MGLDRQNRTRVNGRIRRGHRQRHLVAYTWQRHVKSTRPDGSARPTSNGTGATGPDCAGSACSSPLATVPAGLTAALWPETDGRTPWAMGLALLASAAVTLLYAGLPGERRHPARPAPNARHQNGVDRRRMGHHHRTVAHLVGLWCRLCVARIHRWIVGRAVPSHRRPDPALRFARPGMGPGWHAHLAPTLGTPGLPASSPWATVLAAACLRWTVMPVRRAHWPRHHGRGRRTAHEHRTIGYYGLLDGLLILDAVVLVMVGGLTRAQNPVLRRRRRRGRR